MSDSEKNPEHFGVDTEVFQFMLERDVTHPGLWTSVDEIQTRLAERMKRHVSVEEITNAVTNTRYTQRSPIVGITKILPYNQTFTSNVLSGLKLVEGVSNRSGDWGW
ncbi:hypothetical protein [Pseudomonas viridiflava]|uniref:hypothetical protein n=1 Tax=Pseudomonas viridiflava TaxID=33069 RepID=UPI000F08F896|nr:hypothetical protein [Pseudomonas viridiflava]